MMAMEGQLNAALKGLIPASCYLTYCSFSETKLYSLEVGDLTGVDLFPQPLCVHWHRPSRESLAMLSHRSLFLAIYGVCECVVTTRDSDFRNDMAAHTEPPEKSLYK